MNNQSTMISKQEVMDKKLDALTLICQSPHAMKHLKENQVNGKHSSARSRPPRSAAKLSKRKRNVEATEKHNYRLSDSAKKAAEAKKPSFA
mmetsp:Transcript_21832/g.31259  ORF Transcript_21832/g.31259 Transcript_21832/m.31259 type:complete len:91 (+) Transcript_21832:3-275(+)